tara:strand:- start:337 stop:525 length:189 start_codon:yes stop_codon:yes gene_type:complete
MNRAARTLARLLVRTGQHLALRFDRLKPETPLRASDIIVGMTLVMLVIVLGARFLTSLFEPA